VYGAEMRYFGQLRDINVTLPEVEIGQSFSESDFKSLVSAFHEKHKMLYGWGDSSLPVMLAILKLRAIGKRPPFSLTKLPLVTRDASVAVKRTRQVYFRELDGFVNTNCYDGNLLMPGDVIPGPAVIEEKQTTVVVIPGAVASVDDFNNYLVEVSPVEQRPQHLGDEG
jgi:N-methylhydantoinase A